MEMDFDFLSQILVLGSAICVILAAVGAGGVDLYLASTQWILVGVIFGVWAIYAKLVKKGK
jgi:uncharacterized membrane protein